MKQIICKTLKRSALTESQLLAMHQLRSEVFYSRLEWEISLKNGLDVDEFDQLDPYYILCFVDDVVVGCMRLLTTDGRYMLKNTFSILLHSNATPKNSHEFEISRLAVSKKVHKCNVFRAMLGELKRFAEAQNIKLYHFVTTLAIERILRGIGISTLRAFGGELQIGKENSIALSLYPNDLP